MYGTVINTRSIYAVVQYSDENSRYMSFYESFNDAMKSRNEFRDRKKAGFEYNVVELALHKETK